MWLPVWVCACGFLSALDDDVLPPLDLSLASRLAHQVAETRASALQLLAAAQTLPAVAAAFVAGAWLTRCTAPPSLCGLVRHDAPALNQAPTCFTHSTRQRKRSLTPLVLTPCLPWLNIC